MTLDESHFIKKYELAMYFNSQKFKVKFSFSF